MYFAGFAERRRLMSSSSLSTFKGKLKGAPYRIPIIVVRKRPKMTSSPSGIPSNKPHNSLCHTEICKYKISPRRIELS
mgnify:CR=1 FL=1